LLRRSSRTRPVRSHPHVSRRFCRFLPGTDMLGGRRRPHLAGMWCPASGPGHSCTHGCLRSQTGSGSGRRGRSTCGWRTSSESSRDAGVARRLRQSVCRASTRGSIFSGSGGRLEGGQQTAVGLMPRLRREAVFTATRAAERAQLRWSGDSEAMCTGVSAADLRFFCEFLGPGPTEPRRLNLQPRMLLSSC
jgi:hypothetical protein